MQTSPFRPVHRNCEAYRSYNNCIGVISIDSSRPTVKLTVGVCSALIKAFPSLFDCWRLFWTHKSSSLLPPPLSLTLTLILILSHFLTLSHAFSLLLNLFNISNHRLVEISQLIYIKKGLELKVRWILFPIEGI